MNIISSIFCHADKTSDVVITRLWQHFLMCRTCDPPAPNNPLNNGTNMQFFWMYVNILKLLIFHSFSYCVFLKTEIKQRFSFITLKNITSHIELNCSIMWNKFKRIYYYIFIHPHFSYIYILYFITVRPLWIQPRILHITKFFPQQVTCAEKN